jgi:hypothetical protein
MLRTSLSSAVLVALVSTSGGCAQNPPANTTTAPAVSETAAGPQPAGSGMMGGPGMMGGGQGMMEPGMMDGGQGMMGGQGTMGGQGIMGPGDGGQGMMGGGMMGMGDQCPMFVAGTTVQTKDTSDGMAMMFTTTGDVAELRRRVHVMADHMNAHSSGGGGMGMHGTGMGPDAGMGMGGGMMGGMHSQVEDVDHGARLKMTAADPAKLNEMRQHMKQHVQMMNQSHGCSMMADAGR